jgi:hypothetical protein
MVVIPEPASVAIALDTSFAPLANDMKNKSANATRIYINSIKYSKNWFYTGSLI